MRQTTRTIPVLVLVGLALMAGTAQAKYTVAQVEKLSKDLKGDDVKASAAASQALARIFLSNWKLPSDAAGRALKDGKAKSAPALSILLPYLERAAAGQSVSSGTVHTLLWILVAIGEDAASAVPILHKMLRDPRREAYRYKQDVCWAFAFIGKASKPALKDLKRQCGKPEYYWKALPAGFAIYRITGDTKYVLPALIKQCESPWAGREALIVVTYMGPEAKKVVPALLRSLKTLLSDYPSTSADRACPIIEALGAVGAAHSGVIPALEKCLASRMPLVRAYGAEFLGRIGPEAARATPKLAARLKDKDEMVVMTAAVAIGRIGPKASKATAKLVDALKRSAPDRIQLRILVVRALGKIGPRAKKSLKELKRMRDREPMTDDLKKEIATAIKSIEKE